MWIGIVLTALTLLVICGGIQRIASYQRNSGTGNALFYIALALYVIVVRIEYFPM